MDGLFRAPAGKSPFDEEIGVGRLPIGPPTGRPAASQQRWLRGVASGTDRHTPSGGVPRHGNPNANGAARLISRFGSRPRKRHPAPGTGQDQPGTPGAPGATSAPGGLGTAATPAPTATPIMPGRPGTPAASPFAPPADPFTFPAPDFADTNFAAPDFTDAQFGEADFGDERDPDDGFSGSALDRRLDAEAAALAGARPLADVDAVALRTTDLVRLLHERANELYGVDDTAQVLADDVIERADADAAAVLVPDGPVWRVNGGVGLRPLERRLVLQRSHWLITEIATAGRAVLIEDTDILRQQLAGAPLAAWRHLLAVPVPEVGAIVVLARGQEGGPFTDHELATVIAPAREAATLLTQALQVRDLARALGALRETE